MSDKSRIAFLEKLAKGLSADVEAAERENERVEAALEAAEAQLAQLKSERDALRLQLSERENAQLKNERDALLFQLAEARKECEALARMHTHADDYVEGCRERDILAILDKEKGA